MSDTDSPTTTTAAAKLANPRRTTLASVRSHEEGRDVAARDAERRAS